LFNKIGAEDPYARLWGELGRERQPIEEVKQLYGLPESYSLSQNYPNPFNPTTTINFSIPKSGLVKLIVYNMLGQQIRTLVDKVVNPGNMSATWDGKDSRGMTVSSGIYLYRLTAGSFTSAHKMILLK
jgi:FlgD Ig-like domain